MSRRYSRAAQILQKVSERKGGLKSLVFTEHGDSFTKSVYALVCETLKYTAVIQTLVTKANLDKEYKKKKKLKWLFHVMVYELLFGKGKLKVGVLSKNHHETQESSRYVTRETENCKRCI
eukprot:TRINITY_DN10849_c0_g1_i1.p1 TRINITY_DN10849_c0_g1~~TRINITY_DN10849_c0_g1_i1.p1  ORF type:complete len:120 (-),score=18.08 TRINITY_DN10849_c0_g1_i1:13-372(-)